MANVYAVKSGNWSDTTVWNTGALPTSGDDVFSNNFTVTIDQDVTVLSIRNTAQSPAVAGGNFTLSTGVTVTANGSGFICGATSLINYISVSGGTSSLIGTINCRTVVAGGFAAVNFSGAGTLNVTGNILPNTSLSASNKTGIVLSGTGVLNIIGNLSHGYASPSLVINGAGSTTNITGDVGDLAVNPNVTNAQTITITLSVVATLNVTGNVYGGGGSGTPGTINISASANVNITGMVYGGHSTGYGVFTGAALYLRIVGSMFSSRATSYETAATVSSSASAINLFTGPFISGPYGFVPFSVARMHYIRTLGSYFEFRDETTNGALSPSATAPPTRLVSPDTVVDAPIPANVRNGVSYALGTFTGTLKVPSPDSVAKGVPTDNTVGTAALKPEDVWNYATANLTDANSIGARLKNVSTVETTGEQLEALL